jgi:hypothetical protein
MSMKETSKTGATIAAAAATLFLTGAVANVSTPANAAQGKCIAANICRSACKGKVGASIRKAQRIALAECVAARNKIKAG